MANLRKKSRVQKSRQRHAFTLIELLVVIAIIALLAAILFPVFARARENARKATCQSNLKQIGIGFAMYSQDFDEHYGMGTRTLTDPPSNACFPQTGHFGFQSWMDDIYPYIKSYQLFMCPSGPPSINGGATAYAGQSDLTKYGYGANGLVLPQIYASGVFNNQAACTGFIDAAHSPIALSAINNPSGTMMIGERGTWGLPDLTCPNPNFAVGYDPAAATFQPGGADYSPVNYIATYGSSPDYRHNGFGNFLFSDGHVKSFSMTQMGQLTNPASRGYAMTQPATGGS